jgi:glycosyltransferase involved in cell wall biosynthesis
VVVGPAGITPRVTVILATYNWSSVLPYSIASVLDQTYENFELLVIGDGCTDDSGDVVAAISDVRVHWHNLAANAGHQAGPNNEGIGRARGEVIAYLGHDDLWLPHHLEVLVKAIGDGGTVAHATCLAVAPGGSASLWPPARWTYQAGEWFPPTSAAHAKSQVEAVGGWRHPRDTGLLDPEADLWQRMATLGGPPVWVRRLTSVKFPAGVRRGVYRERPSHEQEYWLQRIRRSEDPEAELWPGGPRRHLGFSDVVRAVRWKTRVRSRLRDHRILPPQPVVTAEEGRLNFRRFKGLDP